jgi:hypothetical protein
MKQDKAEARDAPKVTKKQIADLKQRLATSRHEPLLSLGTQTRCPECGGVAVATNDLRWVTATSDAVFVVTQLPGTRCADCGSTAFDAPALLAAQAGVPNRLLADYETAVTRTSGRTMGTYLKMDLARVLKLRGSERMYWKVLDTDRVLVEIRRGPDLGGARGRGHHRRTSHPAIEPGAETQTA